MGLGHIVGKITDAIGRVVPGRGLDYRHVEPIGWKAHDEAVAQLGADFAALPEGQRVRLGKKSSNLFRGRQAGRARLDVSRLTGVIAIDPVARTADVQGMCTYEDLVDAVLDYGLSPTVVPQLKTITLGGAVTGMGVESTSFRNGLPHEAVLEMDVLTGTGDIVTASPRENPDLYAGFPNSYGSLGYAVRLRIELEPVAPYIELEHIRFHDAESFAAALGEAAEKTGIHGLDGVAFSPEEFYLTVAVGTDAPGPVSDYTRDRIYYRSLHHREGVLRDRLTIRDYIWRWDTDWFWASRAFGAQHPVGRALWPRDLRRSSVYWKLIGLDRRFDIEHNLRNRPRGLPHRERVVQDVEVSVDKLPAWLEWFFAACEIRPMWLCPIRLRGENTWPLYPLTPGTTWVNAGFWSAVPGGAVPGEFNRAIEAKVHELGGHKSLYSEAFYTRAQFEELYGGDLPARLKDIYDPAGRFPGLYEKTVNGG